MPKRVVDVDKLLFEMVEILSQWSSEGIQHIANQVLETPVKYIGNNQFEIDEPEKE